MLWLGLLPASAEIYRWVDESGTHHYTDRPEEVPPEFLAQALGEGALEGLSLEGLNVLPGEADGTDAGSRFQVPDFEGDPTEALQGFLKSAGPGLVAAAIFMSLLVIGLFFAVGAAFLLLACRVIGHPSPGFKKAYGVVIVQTLAGALAGPGFIVLAGPPPMELSGMLTYQLASSALGLTVNALVIRGMISDHWGRSFVIAIVSLLLLFGVGIALGLLVPLLLVIAAV